MEKPIEQTIQFLQKLTRNYYRRADLKLPPDMDYREFAAQLWGSETYIRHLHFNTRKEVVEFAVKKAPRHFYYSSARYEQPGATDMDAKGWISADIVFDIDADHIRGCEELTVRIEDGKLGIKTSITDPKCLREAALRTILLYDILIHELGFERSKVRVEFSGNRGFHVIVETGFHNEWGKADPSIRRELVNYIKAVDLEEAIIRPQPIKVGRRKAYPLEPSESDPGVRGRLARFKKIISGVKGSEADAVEYLSVEVDEQVTVDTKRLIRIPYSLHGKTMLPVLPVDPNRLLDFELTPDISPFKDMDPLRVKAVVDTPVVNVLGHRLRLRRGVSMKLQAPIALFLIARGLAVVA